MDSSLMPSCDSHKRDLQLEAGWVPTVGEEIRYGQSAGHIIVAIVGSEAWVKRGDYASKIVEISKLKPADKQRERTTKQANEVWRKLSCGAGGTGTGDFIAALYEAGLLKETTQ